MHGSLTDDNFIPNVIETYYTWSYIPVEIENGTVGGIVNKYVALSDVFLHSSS